MLLSYTKDAERKTVNFSMPLVMIASIVAMLCISVICGIVAVVFGVLWTVIYCITVKKQFGGVTGDTAGFFLQMFEICSIMGVWIGELL